MAFLATRVLGGGEPDAVALPGLDDAAADELDGFDDFGDLDDDLDESGEGALELTELATDADDDLFDVEENPEAGGIDPLTGRIADSQDPETEPAPEAEPDGPAAFVEDDPVVVVTGNQIDTGLDGRDGIVIVDTDSGRDDGVIIVDGNGANNGTGNGTGAIIIDGDGRRDNVTADNVAGGNGVIVVDANGYAFGGGDGDGSDTIVILDGSDRPDGAFENDGETPELSSMPPAPDVDALPEPEAAPQNLTLADQADIAAAEAMLAEWLAAKNVSGARIGFSYPDGSRTYLTVGAEEDGSALDINREFLATSVTKTMTASIMFNLVSDGLLEVDAPAPQLGAMPDFEHNSAFTIRQLLQHTSGLAPYQASPNWRQDLELNTLTALELAGDVPLENTPGAERGYSNSGYLYLGLLAEQFTGTPYHELIENRISGPLGLESTRIDNARRPGWVGYAAGGLISSVPDLLTWGSALYRDGAVLEPAQLDTMLDVDNEHSTGLGANVICPCGLSDGNLWYTSIGHDGGSVTLQYSPADDMVTSAKFTESFWTQDLAQRDVHKLLRELRAVLSAR